MDFVSKKSVKNHVSYLTLTLFKRFLFKRSLFKNRFNVCFFRRLLCGRPNKLQCAYGFCPHVCLSVRPSIRPSVHPFILYHHLQSKISIEKHKLVQTSPIAGIIGVQIFTPRALGRSYRSEEKYIMRSV